MTTFARGSTHGAATGGLVPQIWKPRDFFKNMFTRNPLAQYMGQDENSIIMTSTDLTKQQGDQITLGNFGELSGDGQGNNGTYLAHEESLSARSMTVRIYEHGHSALGAAGDYSAQSAFMGLKVPARQRMENWAARMQARYIIDSLSGLLLHGLNGNITGDLAVDAASAQIGVVNQVAPTRSATAARYYCGGQTAAGVLSTRVASPDLIGTAADYVFGTKVIEEVRRIAIQEIASGDYLPPMRPIRVDGGEYFLMLIDPLQGKALRADTAWLNSKYYVDVKGKTNPLFSGALGIWDGVVIRECPLLHRRTGAGGTTAPEYFDATGEAVDSGKTVARALFLGAQAGVLAYGKMPITEEGFKDVPVKAQWMTHSRWIAGAKKTAFTNATSGSAIADSEYGCIIVDTAVV